MRLGPCWVSRRGCGVVVVAIATATVFVSPVQAGEIADQVTIKPGNPPTTFSGAEKNTSATSHNFISIGTAGAGGQENNPITSFTYNGQSCQLYAAQGSAYCSVSLPPGATATFSGTTTTPTSSFTFCTSDDSGLDNNCFGVTASPGGGSTLSCPPGQVGTPPNCHAPSPPPPPPPHRWELGVGLVGDNAGDFGRGFATSPDVTAVSFSGSTATVTVVGVLTAQQVAPLSPSPHATHASATGPMLIRSVSVAVKAGESKVELPLVLTKAGIALMKKQRKVGVKLRITFTPTGGKSMSKTVSVTLRLKKSS